MLIKINEGWFEKEKIDFPTYKKLFPNHTKKDFNEFKGIQEPIIIKKDVVPKIKHTESKKSGKKVSKDE